METFSALLALCAGNSPVTNGDFPPQRPVTRSSDVFSDVRLNKRWANNREDGDLRRHHTHYEVIVMDSACGKIKHRPYSEVREAIMGKPHITLFKANHIHSTRRNITPNIKTILGLSWLSMLNPFSWQKYSNLAFDSLASETPANQEPCQVILVNEYVFWYVFYSVIQAPVSTCYNV